MLGAGKGEGSKLLKAANVAAYIGQFPLPLREGIKGRGASLVVFFFLLGFLLTSSPIAHADQYRSQARGAQAGKTIDTPQDLQQTLQTTQEPYEREMLLRELAEKAAQSGDYKAASNYLDQALALHALSDVAEQQMRADLAQLRIGSGDPKAIIATIEPQYRFNPKLPPEQLMALGAAYLQVQRASEALAPLSAAVAAVAKPDPRWRRVLYAAYIATDRDRDAARVLETIVAGEPPSDPQRRDDWLRLSALYLKADDRARAQATMAVANRLGYLDSPIQRQQLIALTAQIGAPFEAASLLRSWIDGGQVPKSADSLRTLAALWVQARETTLAIPAIEEALKARPDRDLYLQLGQIQLDRQSYKAAADALMQAIALGGSSGSTLMALGMAQYQQADIESALKSFGQAGGYAASRDLAGQWVSYLQSGKAREQAMAAAAHQLQQDESVPTLSGAVLGGVGGESRPAAPAPVVPGVAAGSGGLTPVGAEQAGSADGVIPPWTGGLTRSQWPADYQPGGKLKDPFAGEKALYTINAGNWSQYSKWLTQGQQALFARYADYEMRVYPTHRTVAYPQAIYDATQANIGKARTIAADSLADARLGFPFPKPQTGVEVLWNHRVRYRGDTLSMQSAQAVVLPDGSIDQRRQTEQVYFRYGNVADPVDLSKQNILLYYLAGLFKSSGLGDYVLVHETANQLEDSRAIWVIPEGIPRMFRVPPVGYDQPFPGSSGMMFIDMMDMYNGLFDRYVWKLIGKQELLMPYNDYHVSDGSQRYASLLTPHHFNQASVRYERHRVWVVEATLRPGNDHRFGKRVFYVDEDSWNIVAVDNYDHDDHLWRMQEGHLTPDYFTQTASCAPLLTYDFKDGRYFAGRLLAEEPAPRFNVPMKSSDFLPANFQAHYLH